MHVSAYILLLYCAHYSTSIAYCSDPVVIFQIRPQLSLVTSRSEALNISQPFPYSASQLDVSEFDRRLYVCEIFQSRPIFIQFQAINIGSQPGHRVRDKIVYADCIVCKCILFIPKYFWMLLECLF